MNCLLMVNSQAITMLHLERAANLIRIFCLSETETAFPVT